MTILVHEGTFITVSLYPCILGVSFVYFMQETELNERSTMIPLFFMSPFIVMKTDNSIPVVHLEVWDHAEKALDLDCKSMPQSRWPFTHETPALSIFLGLREV
jgi:hypothetical protein